MSLTKTPSPPISSSGVSRAAVALGLHDDQLDRRARQRLDDDFSLPPRQGAAARTELQRTHRLTLQRFGDAEALQQVLARLVGSLLRYEGAEAGVDRRRPRLGVGAEVAASQVGADGGQQLGQRCVVFGQERRRALRADAAPARGSRRR